MILKPMFAAMLENAARIMFWCDNLVRRSAGFVARRFEGPGPYGPPRN